MFEFADPDMLSFNSKQSISEFEEFKDSPDGTYETVLNRYSLSPNGNKMSL